MGDMDRIDLVFEETVQETKDRRERQKKEREQKLKKIEEFGQCEGFWCSCECRKDVKWIGAMTQYPWDIDKNPDRDPNEDLFLCPNCAAGYEEHWQSMWDELHADQMRGLYDAGLY